MKESPDRSPKRDCNFLKASLIPPRLVSCTWVLAQIGLQVYRVLMSETNKAFRIEQDSMGEIEVPVTLTTVPRHNVLSRIFVLVVADCPVDLSRHWA